MGSTRLERMVTAKFGKITYSNGNKGRELIVKCPVCGQKKLTINARSGIYKCWRGCMSGIAKNLFSGAVMAEIDKAAEAREILEERQRASAKARGIPMPGETLPLVGLGADHPAALYLKRRGFSPDVLGEVFGMEYCRTGRKFMRGIFDTTNTLVVPIYTDGDLVGWQARLLYNPDTVNDGMCEALGFQKNEEGKWIRPPKYYTSPGFDKSRAFFNYDQARKGRVAVLCEGVFDAAAVGRCGIAALGKSVSETQLGMLRAYWDIVVILLDPDAEKAARELSKELGNGVVVSLKGYKDAGEAPKEEIWKQICETVDKQPAMIQRGMRLMDMDFKI